LAFQVNVSNGTSGNNVAVDGENFYNCVQPAVYLLFQVLQLHIRFLMFFSLYLLGALWGIICTFMNC